LSAGVGTGIVIMPPFASMLILSFGWRMAFIIIACITLLTPLVFVHFFRRGPAYVSSHPTCDMKSATGNQLRWGCTVRHALGTHQLWILYQAAGLFAGIRRQGLFYDCSHTVLCRGRAVHRLGDLSDVLGDAATELRTAFMWIMRYPSWPLSCI